MSWLEPIDHHDARRFALALRDKAEAARDDLADQFSDFAGHARESIEPRLRHAGKVLKREAPRVAEAALHQAGRMADAARRDPVPVIVGAVGIVLLASLLIGRRRT